PGDPRCLAEDGQGFFGPPEAQQAFAELERGHAVFRIESRRFLEGAEALIVPLRGRQRLPHVEVHYRGARIQRFGAFEGFDRFFGLVALEKSVAEIVPGTEILRSMSYGPLKQVD